MAWTVKMGLKAFEMMWYKKCKEADQEEASFIMQKGNNMAIHMGNQNVSAHVDQIRNRLEDDVCMEEPKVDNGLNLFEGDQLEEYMEEDVTESDMQYDESSKDEIRLRSPLCRTSPQIFRSNGKTKGIRPLCYGGCSDITNRNVSH